MRGHHRRARPRQHMDAIYRYQRYIYDATRKYYLLGRDRMLDELAPPPGGSVLEIGCGTGRNLICAARRYPRCALLRLRHLGGDAGDGARHRSRGPASPIASASPQGDATDFSRRARCSASRLSIACSSPMRCR